MRKDQLCPLPFNPGYQRHWKQIESGGGGTNSGAKRQIFLCPHFSAVPTAHTRVGIKMGSHIPLFVKKWSPRPLWSKGKRKESGRGRAKGRSGEGNEGVKGGGMGCRDGKRKRRGIWRKRKG